MTQPSIDAIRNALYDSCDGPECEWDRDNLNVVLAAITELEAARAQVTAYEALLTYIHDKHPDILSNLSQDIGTDMERIKRVAYGEATE